MTKISLDYKVSKKSLITVKDIPIGTWFALKSWDRYVYLRTTLGYMVFGAVAGPYEVKKPASFVFREDFGYEEIAQVKITVQ